MTLARRLETRIATSVAIVATLLATTTGTVVAHTDGAHAGGGHMWSDGWMTGPGWMGLWGLLWMVLLVAVPLALVYLFARRRDTERGTNPAVAALRERYTRGEIDDEEFDRLRAKLS
ncbi:SHOCT domain-containing protein [Haladaptatus sp. DFWS20]|uniref:SHOCT domain-containing protein n=1 Tax=Haladaptatus sp. DFWS20 TaxID=3403467 RepID=UPI003EBCE57E